MSTQSQYPRITADKRKGIKILLEWSIKKYEKTSSPIAKQMWYQRKEFLAELQRSQFYTENDKEEFNTIRKLYFLDKNYDK